MSEELMRFDEPVVYGGCQYLAAVVGRYRESDRLWEAMIRFESPDGSVRLHTPTETEQHDRDDVLYWAGGLTRVYLEGAIERALDQFRRERLRQAWDAAQGRSNVEDVTRA